MSDMVINESNPYFSVIVLAWRVEKYISECLASIQCQTCADFEVILISPSDNDQTAEICAEFAEKDPRFRILNTENCGQLVNRSVGFSHARGEYLLCVDGDDQWKPELLETVRKGICKHSADLVIFGFEKFNEDGNLDRISSVFPNEAVFAGDGKRAVYEKYIRSTPINNIWIKAMHRSVFQKVEIDFSAVEQIRNSEDLLYSCYVSDAAEKILYLAEPLYRYRIYNSSISRAFRENEIRDYYTVKAFIRRFMTRWSMEDQTQLDAFYRTIAKHTTDWIYRCAVSDRPFSRKRALYRWLKKEAPFYEESSAYWKDIPMASRHRRFVNLFKKSELLLELYARVFKGGKTAARYLKRK